MVGEEDDEERELDALIGPSDCGKRLVVEPAKIRAPSRDWHRRAAKEVPRRWREHRGTASAPEGVALAMGDLPTSHTKQLPRALPQSGPGQGTQGKLHAGLRHTQILTPP